MKTCKKILVTALCALMILSLFAGCGASPAMKDSYSGNSYYENSTPQAPQESGVNGSGSPASVPENRKWIVTVRISAETDDLTALMEKLNGQIAQYGGYIERQYGSDGSYADLTIRIPADRVDGFLNGVEHSANVTSTSKELTDVTLNYVATESRVKALETEQERLLELLSQAADLSDILAIEDRLTDVRYELESTASQLRMLSNMVDYATVDLNIREVKVFTPVAERTVWQRISDGFTENLSDVGEFLTDLLVAVLAGLPTLVLLAAVITVIVLIARHSSRKRKAKRAISVPTPPAEPENDPETR